MSSDHLRHGPPRPEFMALLGLQPPYTAEDVKQAYLAKVRDAHPDRGGRAEDFLKLQEAFERANEYVQFRANRLRWLGGQVERYARQEALLERLRKLGVEAEIEQVDWLNRSFGEDFAQVAEKLVGLSVRGTADIVAVIETLEEHSDIVAALRWLDLSHTRAGDAELWRLGFLRDLQALDVRGTTVTARGLDLLSTLDAIRWVHLGGTSISAVGRWRLGWKFRGVHFVVGETGTAREAIAR